MKNFEKISKMNLADLDRPEGILEEESIQDEDQLVEKNGQNPEDEERSETIVTENIQEQPEELAKKEMMEPQGRHFRVDANVTEKELKAFLFGHTYRQPLMIIVTILAIAWPLAVLIKKQGSVTMPLICSLFILIWIPFTTNLRAKNAKKLNPIYNEEFHYMFDEWGLHLELGDDAIDVEWKKVTKLIIYKTVAVIYTGKNNAFLIPSAAMGTQREEIMNFIIEMKKRQKRGKDENRK